MNSITFTAAELVEQQLATTIYNQRRATAAPRPTASEPTP